MKINEAVKVTIARYVAWDSVESKQVGKNKIIKIESRSFLLDKSSNKFHVQDVVTDQIVDDDFNIYDLTIIAG